MIRNRQVGQEQELADWRADGAGQEPSAGPDLSAAQVQALVDMIGRIDEVLAEAPVRMGGL